MPNKETKKRWAEQKKKQKEEDRQVDLRHASNAAHSYVGKEWSALIS